MTFSFATLLVYVGGLFLLVVSPGPVVAAVVARVLARGFSAALPIAAAVMVGDFVWVSVALFGLSAIISENAVAMTSIQWLGALYLLYLGVQEFRHAHDEIHAAELSKSKRFWPNFRDGLVIILTNPKAALFYIAVVPKFFDIPSLTKLDILAIGIVTAIVPFVGNTIWAASAHYAKSVFDSPEGAARLRQLSGLMLILVALALIFI